MFALRISLSLGAVLFSLLAGRQVAHAVLTEAVPASSLTSTSFRLSESGIATHPNALESASFSLTPGTLQTVQVSAGSNDPVSIEQATVSSGGGGGGGRRERATTVAQVSDQPGGEVVPSNPAKVVQAQDIPPSPPISRSSALEAKSPTRPRRVVAQPSLRPVAQSESVDLSPLVALSTKRSMIARAPLQFQDSWHRPHSIDFLGAEIAEAYEAYAEARSVRVSRVVDLINQNLLLSSLLVFAAVALSVLGTSSSMRRRCTTIVCVLERQIATVQPKMGYTRLLLRIFLLVFSLGIFFWLTTAYAFAATTAPLRHIYNGRLLNSAGTALTTAHTIRLSYWTSADHVSSDTTEAGAIDTSASTFAGWNEVHTVTPNSDGYFSLELGSVTTLPTMDSLSVSTLLSLFLQVEVKAASDADTSYELLDSNASSATIDRSPVFSVPFALNADMVDQRDVGTGSGSIPLLESGAVLAKTALPAGLTRDIFTIDSDDSASEPTLRFGDALAKTLSFTNGAFRFNDDLLIAGSLTIDQDLSSGTGILVDSEATGAPAIAIDIQGSAVSPHILFGSGGTFDTALFRETANTLRLNGSFKVSDTLSGTSLKADRSIASSGALSIAGATNLQSSLDISGAVTLQSTLSGASTVTLSTLKSCTGLGTNVNGTLACATTPVIIRKSADEIVSNSATLQDDDHLTFAIGANETWVFTVHLIGDSGSTPDFAFAVNAPTGSSCTYSVNAENVPDASAHNTCGATSDRMSGNGDDRPYKISGTVASGSTSGQVTFQWSQFGSNAYTSTIRAGSYLVAQRIQ